jgi:hypothetical protein
MPLLVDLVRLRQQLPCPHKLPRPNLRRRMLPETKR